MKRGRKAQNINTAKPWQVPNISLAAHIQYDLYKKEYDKIWGKLPFTKQLDILIIIYNFITTEVPFNQWQQWTHDDVTSEILKMLDKMHVQHDMRNSPIRWEQPEYQIKERFDYMNIYIFVAFRSYIKWHASDLSPSLWAYLPIDRYDDITRDEILTATQNMILQNLPRAHTWDRDTILYALQAIGF